MRTPAESSLQAQSTPARLIEGALDVARAEGALAMVQVREVAVRALGALLLTIVAAAFAQVAIVLAVLSPLLREVMSWLSIALAAGLPALLALICGWGALGAWRRIPRESARSGADGNWAAETPSPT